jgi:transcriptional regulator with XRE-family HTH domain
MPSYAKVWNAIMHEVVLDIPPGAIGSYAKHGRHALSLSQAFVAAKIGVTTLTYHKWESGQTSLIGPGYVAAIAAVCDPDGLDGRGAGGHLATVARQIAPLLRPSQFGGRHTVTLSPKPLDDMPPSEIDYNEEWARIEARLPEKDRMP